MYGKNKSYMYKGVTNKMTMNKWALEKWAVDEILKELCTKGVQCSKQFQKNIKINYQSLKIFEKGGFGEEITTLFN